MSKDSMTLRFWHDHRKQLSPRVFYCFHNGWYYGNKMPVKNISFVYEGETTEEFPWEKSKTGKMSLREPYRKVVEKACLDDNTQEVLKNFIDNTNANYKIYAEDKLTFDDNEVGKKIKAASYDINPKRFFVVKQNNIYTKFYIACDLNWCEYFESLSSNILSKDLDNWIIQIEFDESDMQNMDIDPGEDEIIDLGEFDNNPNLNDYNCEIEIVDSNNNSSNKNRTSNRTAGSKKQSKGLMLDWDAINKKKITTGKLGEQIALKYEKSRIKDFDKFSDKLLVHTSATQGDGYGYDIESINDKGKTIYIEVKSTTKNTPLSFYFSENEKNFANDKKNKDRYYLYRIYNIKVTKDETSSKSKVSAKLKIFEPPFTNRSYAIKEIKKWFIRQLD